MERAQRTKLDKIVLHEPRLAQGQLCHQGMRLFDRCHVQEEDGAFSILAKPPLVDLASQKQPNRIGHFSGIRASFFARASEVPSFAL